MPFSYMDHTGDIGIDLDSATFEDLLADASRAFVDILTDPSLIVERETVELAVRAPNPTDLLLDWLEELLFLFDTRGLIGQPKELAVTNNDDGELCLEALISGEEIDPARHPVHIQIKAVTYHCLEVKQEGERWLGRVIFDI